jgi:PIN domain nuclease of toxin-antitoxin system
MNLLLDTHVFIWWAVEPQKLPVPILSALQNRDNTLALSVVSIWELQMKTQLGRLTLPLPAREFWGKTCYNSGMDKSDVRAYAARWEAIAKIERKELQATTLAEKWRQLNAIKRRAARLGITRENNDGEMEIFLLWARLKVDYAAANSVKGRI